MNILDYHNYYFVGVTGVGMTALAQVLLNLGKNVAGWDVSNNFVTKKLLAEHHIRVDIGPPQLPANIDCLIFTGAHQGSQHPLIQLAKTQQLPVLSHAEALGQLFNAKEGIAVCGVGGKSTVSAMLAWVFDQQAQPQSCLVGVGYINGLNYTGRWDEKQPYFVAEADEYAQNPEEIAKGQPAKPRFSYLRPTITICTNLQFDHPDVYQDQAQTEKTFSDFFASIKPNGTLIYNADDEPLFQLVTRVKQVRSDLTLIGYGQHKRSEWQITEYQAKDGSTSATVQTNQNEIFHIKLKLPGLFSLKNALATIVATQQTGMTTQQAIQALAMFDSTSRRFEHKGQLGQVKFFDDYAHHPAEIQATLMATKEWFANEKLTIVFQAHTYTRTKALLEDFAQSFDLADQVIIMPIFASAREKNDDLFSHQNLATAISAHNPKLLVKTLENFADLKKELKAIDSGVVLTLGAGDISQIYQLLNLVK